MRVVFNESRKIENHIAFLFLKEEVFKITLFHF